MRRIMILGAVVLSFYNILVIVQSIINEDKIQVLEFFFDSDGYSFLKEQDIYENLIPFQSKQTFIIVKILRSRWSIFYWLGKEANLNQKKVTARYAVHKWKSLSGIPDNPITGTGQFGHGSHDAMYCKIDKTSRSFTLQPSEKSSKNLSSVFELPIKTPELIIPNIYRESDGNESDLFVTYIEQYAESQRFKSRQNIMELYEIKWDTNIFFTNGAPTINLIPLWSEINEKDNIYILDKGNKIVKSGNNTNRKLKEIKNALVYNLITEKLPNQVGITYSKTQSTIRNHFQIPEIFNQQPSIPNTGQKIFSKIELLSEGIKIENVKLSFKTITERDCYILQNESIHYIFIHFGKSTSSSEIFSCLEKAEEIIHYNPKYRKIIFAVDTDIYTLNENLKYPTAFWVNFDERPTGFLPINPKNTLSSLLFNRE